MDGSDSQELQRRSVSKRIFIILGIFFAVIVFSSVSVYFGYNLFHFDTYSQEPIEIAVMTLSDPPPVQSVVALPLAAFPGNYETVLASAGIEPTAEDRVKVLRFGMMNGSYAAPWSSSDAEILDLCSRYAALGDVDLLLTAQNIDLYYRQMMGRTNNEIITSFLSDDLDQLLSEVNGQLKYLSVFASPDEKDAISELTAVILHARDDLDAGNYSVAVDTISNADGAAVFEVFMKAAGKSGQLSTLSRINSAHIILGYDMIFTSEASDEGDVSLASLGSDADLKAYLSLLQQDIEPSIWTVDDLLMKNMVVGRDINEMQYKNSLQGMVANNSVTVQDANADCTISDVSRIFVEPNGAYYQALSDITAYRIASLSDIGIESERLAALQISIDSILTYFAKQDAGSELSETDRNSLVDIMGDFPSLTGSSDDSFYQTTSFTRMVAVSYAGSIRLATAPAVGILTCEGEVCTSVAELLVTISSENFNEPYAYPQVAQSAGSVRIPILMYHHISDPPVSASSFTLGLYVSPAMLEQQIAYLTAMNYKTITPDELYSLMQVGLNPPQKSVMLTFDDATEGQYISAFPILRKYGQRGVFYITSSRSSISAAQLSEMAHAGMVIGSHGATHVDLAKTDDAAVLSTEISGSKAALQSMTGMPVTSIAYPGCVADGEAISVVGGSGYLTGLSCGRSIDHYIGNRLMLSRVHVFNDMDRFTKLLSGINE